MPNVKSRLDPSFPYGELRRRVQQTLFRAHRQIEQTKVRAYWDTGRDINEHIKIHGGRAEYGESVILRLSEYLDLDDSLLHRFSELAAAFPKEIIEKLISVRGQKLPGTPRQISKNDSSEGLVWRHFRFLIPVKDEQLRFRLARQAFRYGWSVPELQTRIKSLSSRPKSGIKSLPAPEGAGPQTGLLEPKKGELFTYRIILDAGAPAIDQGFAKYWNLSGGEVKKFREGDIVQKLPGRKMEKLKNGTKSLLYTYEAEVTRVVDGDTIWMKIYLEGKGRPPWVKEKLRLRGIDAPELKTSKGRAAKKFVEDEIAGQPGQAAIRGSIKQARAIGSGKRILITTTKPDKWDRYLSDVFLISSSGEGTYLNNRLLATGHARLKTDWSLSDWEST